MKILILALSLSVAALTTSVARANDSVVELRSASGYLVPVHISEIKSTYKQIVENEIATLESIAEKEQEIYKFAAAFTGLNMTSIDARHFSERMAQNVTEPKLLAVITDAGHYAVSFQGLNLSHADAAKFVELLCSFPQAQQRLALYKKTYAFAVAYTGMNLSQREAREYADRKSGLVTK